MAWLPVSKAAVPGPATVDRASRSPVNVVLNRVACDGPLSTIVSWLGTLIGWSGPAGVRVAASVDIAVRVTVAECVAVDWPLTGVNWKFTCAEDDNRPITPAVFVQT